MALDYILKINGQTLSDLGLAVMNVGDAWTYAGVERGTDPVPGALGAFPQAVVPGQVKVIPITVTFNPTITERAQDVSANLALLDGLVELEWGDGIGRIQWGYVDTAEVRARFRDLAWLTGHVEVPLDIVIPHAVSFEREVQSVIIDSTDRRLDTLGDATSKPWFVFPGSFSSLTITYKSAIGDTLDQLVISGAVGADEWLEVDTARGADGIILGDASDQSRTLKPDYYSSGGFPTFDPGDGRLGLGPKISATESGVCYYRRAYL